jgi:hypothetical protein
MCSALHNIFYDVSYFNFIYLLNYEYFKKINKFI